MNNDLNVSRKDDHIIGRFTAMASPCELLMDTQDLQLAKQTCQAAYDETKRIEQKYSRYLTNNDCANINNSNGKPVAIDDETYRLLTFAQQCYDLSNGLFDITSGVLRKAWKFDGSSNVPPCEQVETLLPFIGWPAVKVSQSSVTLPVGFEIDFGGIGKEYAVDCVAKKSAQLAPNISILVNFGGDIQVTRPREKGAYWYIGIEDPTQQATENDEAAIVTLKIASGGLATSGDAKRYLMKDGVRYSHILNPLTGYPITDAPRSVTVAAEHCTQAGLIATLALLQGYNAELFLKEQQINHWCYR